MKEQMDADVLIVGAGPAGLMAGIQAQNAGSRVVLLEKNDQPGKKLLVSGGGQCNLTNGRPLPEFLDCYYGSKHFIKKILWAFPPDALMNWFRERRVPLDIQEDGRVFPASRRASQVLETLWGELKMQGGVLRCQSAVKAIEVSEEGFRIHGENQTWNSRRVIIATGGQSYENLGTTGDGYQLAVSLGHHVVSPRPALSAVKVVQHPLHDLSGMTLAKVPIIHWKNGAKQSVIRDDLMITRDGLSGPVILNHARNFFPGDQLTLHLADPLDETDLRNELMSQMEKHGKKQVANALDIKPVPQRLLERVLEMAGIDCRQKAATVTKKQRKALVRLLVSFPLSIQEVHGFDEAMVTAGGVDVREVRATSLESVLVPGLFFAGEVLDVDGWTGGFNLQFSLSSGWVAGMSVASHHPDSNP